MSKYVKPVLSKFLDWFRKSYSFQHPLLSRLQSRKQLLKRRKRRSQFYGILKSF